VSRIDTADSVNNPVRFSVSTAGPAEAFIGMVTFLEARLIGVDTADKRLGILWRVLRDLSPDTAGILHPHSLQTQASFRKVGVYALELAVTIGATIARDTLVIPVREAPAPAKAKLIAPTAGETLHVGMVYKVAWEMPVRGPVSIQLSTLAGKDGWRVLADSVASVPGISYFSWTPPENLAGSLDCSIRILHSGPDTLVAGMEGTFSILSRAEIVKDTAR
jgi:hypothetical protein